VNNQEKKELFRKYLENRCSAEEKNQIIALLQAEGVPVALQAIIDEDARKQLRENRQPAPEISGRMLAGVRAEIQQNTPEKTRKIPHYIRLAAAALAGFLMLAGGFLYLNWANNKTVYITGDDQTQYILLPDSSEVTLNANSKLAYVEDEFTANVREIWLEGEGYFHVRRKEKPVPFIVHTDNLQVEVLGTEFNVNTRKEKTQVVLNTGKVKLVNSLRHNELIMAPGELVEVSETVPVFTKRTVDPDVYTAWRKHKLVFDGTRLTEVLQILEDQYGFEVRAEGQAIRDEMVFTGSVSAHDIDLLLTLLSESFHLQITREGNTIRIGE